jgi:hypothetical protein
MAKDAIVSQELAEKFKTEKDSPYLRFVRAEGLDVISAHVPNLRTVERVAARHVDCVDGVATGSSGAATAALLPISTHENAGTSSGTRAMFERDRNPL